MSKSYRSRQYSEITHEVYRIATLYPGMIKVYEPNKPIHKKLPDWELQSPTLLPSSLEKTSNETNLERSIRRSQKSIYDIILSNPFDLWVTLTVSTDRFDDNKSKNKPHYWLKNQRNRNGKTPYILVPERHKNGALHYHALMRDFKGLLVPSKTKSGRNKVRHGEQVYELPSYRSGWTDAQYLKHTPADRIQVARYISKYITKETVSIFHKKRYWTSQGLNRPTQEDNPQWTLELVPDDVFENDYGRILTFVNLENRILPDHVRRITDENQLWN